MIEIRVADHNDQLIEAVLDGTLFFIRMRWNEAAKQWFIGLRNSEQDLLLDGIAVCANYPIFKRLRKPYMPLGDLIVIKETRGLLTRDTFNLEDAQLIYAEEADLIDMGLLNEYGRL